MWEERCITVTKLGEKLYLDSGTLTPLLKKLEQKHYISRQRSKEDERTLDVTLTSSGLALRDKALSVPEGMGKCVKLTSEEAQFLYKILHKILNDMN